MARVRATAVGFDGAALRQPGEEFDFDGAPGQWFVFLNPKDKEEAERKHAEARAKAKRADIEAQVRAELEVKLRAEAEVKLRKEIEADLRKQIEAEVRGAKLTGKKDSAQESSLV